MDMDRVFRQLTHASVVQSTGRAAETDLGSSVASASWRVAAWLLRLQRPNDPTHLAEDKTTPYNT